jgi:hypothetical protein
MRIFARAREGLCAVDHGGRELWLGEEFGWQTSTDALRW